MPNTLYVTLDQTTTPWSVDVNQSNNANDVAQNALAQTITWQLSGNAAAGTFNSLTDPHNPGFAWTGTAPRAGIFHTPALNANGNTLTISDLNNSSSTTGSWNYKMCINVGGTLYTTITTGIRGTNTNPSIKNR
ncbi:MAG: hypothetical protein ABIY40_01055 [Rhodanobacteraceae bacterium]